MRLISILLALIGAYGAGSNAYSLYIGDLESHLHGLSLFILFIILGGLGLYYKNIKYKGGAPTIIGTIMIGLGLNMIVFEIDVGMFSDVDRGYGGYVLSGVFMVLGVILVVSGHKNISKIE